MFLPNHDKSLAAPPRTLGRAAFVVSDCGLRHIPYTFADYRALRDPALDYVLHAAASAAVH